MLNANLVKGTVFVANLPVFEGSFRNARFSHEVRVKARVLKESYSSRGQHTFTFEVLESSDTREFAVGAKYRKMGRNLYPNLVEIVSQPDNYDEVAAEKSARKEAMRAAKESREAVRKQLVEQYVASGMQWSDAVQMAADVLA